MDVPPEPISKFLLGLVLTAWTLDSVLIDRSLFGDPRVQLSQRYIGRPLIGLILEPIDVKLVIEVHSKIISIG
jgi:hypothetical protein